MKQDTQYEVIIIGGSYAGLAAGMALGRALRKVLIIDGGHPCNQQTPHSHNFLTNDGKTPREISLAAKQELQQYPTVSFLQALATKGIKTNEGFEILVSTGQSFEAKKLIFATGIRDLHPGIPGFSESWGISILHCPYCHGYEVRGKKTGILANGDTAFELATLISNWTKDLTIYTNGIPAFSNGQLQKLSAHSIGINENTIDRFENKNGFIKRIHFANGQQEPVTALYTRLPFQQHSDIPSSLGCAFTPEGYIQTGSMQQTGIAGIYACGDNSSKMRTVANAVATGTTTGIMVNKSLIEASF